MAIGFGLHKIILPGLRVSNSVQASEPEHETGMGSQQLLEGPLVKIFIGFLFAYGVMSNIYLGSQTLTRLALNSQDMEAFHWARTTPADSRFLLITQENPLLDPSSEWFPALAERRSVATVYGYEWINDGSFGARLERARALQKCAVQGVACLEQWQAEAGESYSYLYIRKVKNGVPVEVPLVAYLELSPSFENVYQTETVSIFQRK
jgi:hypothetical protein